MEVFLTSPWVPAEWIRAHGLEPRGVWFSKDFDLESLPLAAGACSFANAVVRLADKQAGSAVVFTTHCDQLRRGFDAVTGSASAGVFLFNLPVTWQTPVAARIFASELERLGQFLVGLGGHTPANEELTQLLAECSRSRIRLLEAAADCPARLYAEAIAQFHWDGSVNLPTGAESRRPQSGADLNSIPVALVGGPLPRSQWHVLDAIESAGGRVVLNATEAGERSLWSTPSPASELALQSLTRAYLDHYVDVFQRPNTRLYQWLKQRLTARKARGILLWQYLGCDLWRAEAQSLREAFGLPVLVLEADEAASESSRQSGRIQAFMESLR